MPPCVHFPPRSAAGILVCIATTFIATDLEPARIIAEIEPCLKIQLIVSTILMTPVAYFIATMALPEEFTLSVPGSNPNQPFDTK